MTRPDHRTIPSGTPTSPNAALAGPDAGSSQSADTDRMTGSATATEDWPAAETYGGQAAKLVAEVDCDRWGRVRPSLYETARVLSAAPWLPGSRSRIAYLLQEQATDGSWGEGPAPYRLLPTLSGVEAALAVLQRGAADRGVASQLAAAAADGLAALRGLATAGPWPDTAGAEILVPHLVAVINEHLSQAATAAVPGLGPWHRGPGLSVPHGYHEAATAHAADRCQSAGSLPIKLHHTFEGIARHVPRALLPGVEGLLGSSPAATAAWAAATPSAQAARQHAVAALLPVADRYGGLFPEAAPVTVVERLWVAAALAGPGLPSACLPTVRAWAGQIYDPQGVRGAPGLMPDADDTAMAVLVAALVGQPRDPAPLAVFDNGSHYDCYVGEDTGSVTANAHVLQALDAYLRHRPESGRTYRPRTRQVRDWLIGQQQPEGHWADKWHASPYYATQRCVTALAPHGGGRQAVQAAADWVVDTQGPDGSWGVWSGTSEETAYAVKILLHAGRARQYVHVLKRAGEFMCAALHDPGHRHPALWHDKTLYAPESMVEAEVLAALEMLRTHQEG